MVILSLFISDFPVFFLLCLSLVLSFRLLKFPDLSIDASYAGGMTIFAYVAKSLHAPAPVDLFAAVLLSLGFGAAIGATLTFLHKSSLTRIGKLLSGLIVAFVAYALVFRINGFATSQGLYNVPHSLNLLRQGIGGGVNGDITVFVVMLAFSAVFAFLALILVNSRVGLLVRASGHRAVLVEQGGRSSGIMLGLGLAASSSSAALAGMMRAATDNFADINTFGTFLFALAGVLCGERLLSISSGIRERMISPPYRMLAAIVGSVVISVLIAASIFLLNAVFGSYFGADIRFVIGLLVALLAARVMWDRETQHLSDD